MVVVTSGEVCSEIDLHLQDGVDRRGIGCSKFGTFDEILNMSENWHRRDVLVAERAPERGGSRDGASDVVDEKAHSGHGEMGEKEIRCTVYFVTTWLL